jgi:hypothetical protein
VSFLEVVARKQRRRVLGLGLVARWIAGLESFLIVCKFVHCNIVSFMKWIDFVAKSMLLFVFYWMLLGSGRW